MRVLPWIVTIGICLSVTSGLAAVKYAQISAAIAMAESFPPPYSVVTQQAVTDAQWTPVRKLTGSVRAPQFVAISAEATGRIVALPRMAGEVVTAGDVVLQLFDEDLKAQREALKADQNLVDVQLKRIRQLKADSLASQDQLDTLIAQEQSLNAQLAANEAQLSRLTVRAPFTGRLGIYTQSVGDLMNSGDLLTTLTDTSTTRWVDFKVPQGVARVGVGDTVRLLSIDNTLVGEAEIIAVSDALTAGTRSFDVRAAIESTEMRHGELVLVEIRTRRPSSAKVVPSHAVRWDEEGPHVFLLKDAGEDAFVPFTAQLTRVEVIAERNQLAYLEGDLAVGDSVAVEGAFKLADGSLAKVVVEEEGE